MPHFALVKFDNRSNVLDLVKDALQTSFFAKGLVHEDVAWRNIGLYMAEGKRKAIIFDLGRVRKSTQHDTNWVHATIEGLRNEA